MRKSHPMKVQAIEGNLPKVLQNIQRAQASEYSRDRQPDSISELSPIMGDLNGAQVDYSDAGGVKFASGEGYFDIEGLHLNGVRYGIKQEAVDPNGLYPREASLELFYPTNQTYPAWRLRLSNTSGTANLFANGDFSTGDTTGWYVLDPAASITAESDGAGGYRGRFTAAGTVSSRILYANTIAVTGGDGYYVEATVSAESAGAGLASFYGALQWYTSGTVPIGSAPIIDLTPMEPLDNGMNGVTTRTIHEYMRAPKNAAFAVAYFSINSTEAFTFLIDDAKFIQRDFVDFVLDLDGGLQSGYLNFEPTSTTVGPDYDTASATSHASLIGGVMVDKPLRVTGALWDVRQTGDYVLYLANYTDGLAIRQLWSGTVASAGEITMTFDAPLTLLTGVHYLRLYRSTGASTWWTVAAAYGSLGDDFRLNLISRDMGGSWAAGCIPVKLVYQPGEWS